MTTEINTLAPSTDEQGWKRQGFAFGAELGLLQIWSHSDTGYRKRTAENARCDATMATAADYSTGGERLTAQMAGTKYLPLPLFLEPDEAGKRLAQFMAEKNAASLNVAGNGIYTMDKKGWTQSGVNQWIYDCIAHAHSARPIARIQTGGQTGADMAGAIAAIKLGIPCKILMPAGFKQRDVRERDFFAVPAELALNAAREARELFNYPRPVEPEPTQVAPTPR